MYKAEPIRYNPIVVDVMVISKGASCQRAMMT